MSEAIPEPYIIVHNYAHDIRVYISLENFQILGNRPRKLDKSELEDAIRVIKENCKFLLSSFYALSEASDNW